MPTLSSNIVKLEVASVADVEQALARQALYGGDLATNLLELSHVSEAKLAQVIADSLGLEPAPSGELPRASESARRLVPSDIARRYGLCPLEELDGKLVVAVSEPLPQEVVSDLEFSLGLPLLQRATTLVRVQQAVAREYGLPLDQRAARVLARLAGEPDPHPSVPVTEAPTPPPRAEPDATVDAASVLRGSLEPPIASKTVPAGGNSDRSVEPVHHEVDRPPAAAARPSAQQPSVPRAPQIPNVDLFAFARPERKSPRHTRHRGPYTLAMAEEDLLAAETRDEVIAAFFDFAAQYFEYAALFQVHGDIAEGRDAQGLGAPRAKVLALGIPLDLPSTLSKVVANDPYKLVRLSATGIDGALAKDLERRPGPSALLLPIRVRERAVLVLYADHGANDVNLEAIGDVLSFAPLVATALERMILRRKTRGQRAVVAKRGALREPKRAELPSRGERASALVSVLESGPWSQPAAPNEEERPPSLRPLPSVPPLARPMISIGPSRPSLTPSAPPLSARNGLSRPKSLPSTSRTPIPSSFAPGAPPQPRALEPQRAAAESPEAASAEERSWDIFDAPATDFSSHEPSTRPGVGSRPPGAVVAHHRETPIQMPAPPAGGSVVPPSYQALKRAAAPVGGDELARTRRVSAEALSAGVNTQLELETTQRYRVPVAELHRSLDPEHAGVDSDAGEAEIESGEDLDMEQLDADPAQPASPEIAIEVGPAIESDWLERGLQEDGVPIAPRSRSIAHSARPLPAPGSSKELRLPAVIVDLAQDTEDLVQRAARGDNAAAERLVRVGAAAVPALVGAFPGPITQELRRGAGEGPPRASECGPLLSVLARIGPRAAGVLAVRSNDKDPSTRAWATRLLGEMPCLDAARAIARRFVDDDAEVRRAALAAGRMLQNHQNSSAALAGTLSEMLLDSTRQDRLQHMVIEAIADLREARAVPALATLLATGSPEVQRSAHWALVVLARTDYADNSAAWDEWWRVNASRHRIEWLIDALMHDTQDIRRAAGDELKSLTKEYFGYYDDLPPRERERAQKRYRDWWDSKGKARFA